MKNKKFKGILLSLDTLFATLITVIAITILFTSHIYLVDFANFKNNINKQYIALAKSNKEILLECYEGAYRCRCTNTQPQEGCHNIVVDRIINESNQKTLIHCYYCID